MNQVDRSLIKNSVVVPSATIDARGAAADAHNIVLNISMPDRVLAGPYRSTRYNTEMV